MRRRGHLGPGGRALQSVVEEIAGLQRRVRDVVVHSPWVSGPPLTIEELWRAGLGVLGLSQALLSAGARSVVATLWPVDDRVTARFVGQFYAGLLQGAPTATALKRAQDAIRVEPETHGIASIGPRS